MASAMLRERDLNPRPLGHEPNELAKLLHPALNLVAIVGLEPTSSAYETVLEPSPVHTALCWLTV